MKNWLCECNTLNSSRDTHCPNCQQQNPNFKPLTPVTVTMTPSTVPISIMPSSAIERLQWWNSLPLAWQQFFELSFDIENNKTPPDYALETIFLTPKLKLCGCYIKDLLGITCLHNLVELDAIQCNIKSLTGIENLLNLKILSINQNRLLSFKGIEKLHSLKVIYAQDNNLKTITHLASLKSLSLLNISHNIGLSQFEIKQLKKSKRKLKIIQ